MRSYDPERELAEVEAYETVLDLDDRVFDARRFEPLEGLGRVYRADENIEEEAA